jgi:predicted PurR-regulated permease PerM
MEETVKVIVVSFFSIAALAGVIKWAIEKYFKQSEEVMRLKEELNQKSIRSIEDSMNRVALEIIKLGQNMAELEQSLIVLNLKLQEYDRQSLENLQSYVSLASEIRKKLQVFEDLELYELKENTFIFKKKNH